MDEEKQPKLEKTKRVRRSGYGSLAKAEDKLRRLKELVGEKKSALLVLQDDPDPDALAAAAGLRLVLHEFSDIRCVVSYKGPVSRPENRTLAKALELPFRDIREVEEGDFALVAMLDTQPGAGNNSLPPERVPEVVIDHHPFNREAGLAAYSDIRGDYGATSTIIYEYLAELKVEPDPVTAAALIYGIRTDTQTLTRDTTRADVEAYIALYPKASLRLLNRIEHSPFPREYFGLLLRGLSDAEVHGRAVVSVLDKLSDASMVSQVADLLLRVEGMDYAVCLGLMKKEIAFSVRSVTEDAEALAKALAGSEGTAGGHTSSAGGQMSAPSAKEKDEVRRRLIRRLRKAVRCKSKPKRLVAKKEFPK